jgi:AcrR family transcriptional regulator
MAYRATQFTKNRKIETHNRLLQEAKALVSHGGFRALSIAEVASRAGIATGTVYRYFPSKSELCVAVFEQATQREIEAVDQASKQGQNCTEQLHNALSTFIKRALKSPTLAYALIAEPVDPELEHTRLRYRAKWAESFARLIQHGISQGLFYPQPEHISATALVGAMAETVIVPLQLAQKKQAPASTPLTQHHCEQIIAFCLRAVVKPETPV